jgi:hypothetical protein
MAAQHINPSYESPVGDDQKGGVQTKDRGLCDFLGKRKDEKKPQEEVIVTEFEKCKVSEPEPKVEEHYKQEEQKDKKEHAPSEKFRRSGSSSSSVCIYTFHFYFFMLSICFGYSSDFRSVVSVT